MQVGIMRIHPRMPRLSLVAALLLGALPVLGCGAQQAPYVWVKDLPPSNEVRSIQAGDTLAVVVKDQTELSGSFTVLENGTYQQPVVGPVQVAGLTEEEASKRLAGLLEGIVIKPQVAITVSEPRPVNIGVVGEVEDGGPFTVQPDESLLAVIARAGGLTPYADKNAIYVVRKRPRILRIRFRYDDLVGADQKATTFRLHDGDVIVVE